MNNAKIKQHARALYESLKNISEAEREKRFDNFLKLLKRNGRIRLLPRIVKELEAFIKKEEEKKTVRVTAAVELAPESAKDIIQRESSAIRGFQDKMVVRRKRDDTLIGGYVVETREQRIDKSYKGQLLRLYKELVA